MRLLPPAPEPAHRRRGGGRSRNRLRAPGVLLLAALASSRTLNAAQAEATLDLGASYVEYEGFLGSGAAVLAPGLRFDSRRLSMAGQASWTMFESGNSVLQGTAAAAWLAHARGSVRLELLGTAGASSYASEPATGHVLGGARLHFFSRSAGGWIGMTSGASSGGPSGTPVELVLAGWSARNSVALVGSLTATSQGPVRFLDLLGAVRWTRNRIELEARAGARPWARDTQADAPLDLTGGFGEVTAVISLNQRLALSLGGGRYLSDPVRRVLGASYVSAGFRLRTRGSPPGSVPGHTTGVLRGRAVPTEEAAPPLEVLSGGLEERILRVRAPAARSVELMADFTDWSPVQFRQATPGVWEFRVRIEPGVHRVNLRIDGGSWTAPGGARLERTDFGGTVGIIVIQD